MPRSKNKNRKLPPPPAIAANVAADLAAASDTVAAIGMPPDAENAAPASPVVPIPPRRCSVGNGSHVDPANVHPLLTFNGGTLNGIGPVKRRDTATVNPVPITESDAPALYHRAAVLIALASHASINAPDRIGASPLDRMTFLTRAAERCIYTADRVTTGKTPVRNFSGGFNGTDAVRMRIASVRSLDVLPTADVSLDALTADMCDPLIVAYLAARKTATRPDGGYFAVNVGTINR